MKNQCFADGTKLQVWRKLQVCTEKGDEARINMHNQARKSVNQWQWGEKGKLDVQHKSKTEQEGNSWESEDMIIQ